MVTQKKAAGGGNKGKTTTAAQSAALLMEVKGSNKRESLKKTETHGEGVSDAVKEAFVADAKGEPIDEDDE